MAARWSSRNAIHLSRARLDGLRRINRSRLSGVYKLGFWYDTRKILPIRSSTTPGIRWPIRQQRVLRAASRRLCSLWRDGPDDLERSATKTATATLNFFARVMGTPQADRNLIDFSLNAGFTMHEPIPHRDDDTFGIGMGYAQGERKRSPILIRTPAFSTTRSIPSATRRNVRGSDLSISAYAVVAACSRISNMSLIPAAEF